MKIGKAFNQLEKEEYFFFIENHKTYTDFNTLGLYRSLNENENLNIEDRIEIRDFAHRYFQKTFDFLQLKDPFTYIEVVTLGEALTDQEKRKFWDDVRKNQQKILQDKKIKHRNFGVYSKHDCGVEHCLYNGLMIKQGTIMARNCMFFDTDENKDEKFVKAKRLKKEKRFFKQNKNQLED